MLTKTQKKIIRQIRRLYRKREPLNITAVKREHPKLIKAVYDVKPFWGWKRALEDAGIDYSDIKVELFDYVVCEICGIERCSVAVHLARTHGTNKYEYRMDYPDADIFCEELRARISKMKAAVLPHWEPLWTREYVMDRIMELHKLGLRLNQKWMRKNEPRLEEQATERFGCWSDALKAVGLDPTKIRINRPSLYKRPKEVLRELRRRKREGLPVNYGAICHGEHTDPMLSTRASAFFGSWKNALAAAGIDAAVLTRDLHRQSRKYPDKESVIEEIRRREANGLPINSASIETGPHRDGPLVLKAREYFGLWGKALQEAGVGTEEMMRRTQKRRYPDKKSVISGITKRRQAGLPLNMTALFKRPGLDTVLWLSGQEYFGSWSNALRAAGIDPDAIRRGLGRKRRRYPDKKSVISGIRKRRQAGLPLNGSALFKRPALDTALWTSAREYFGSWNKALRAAGVRCRGIKRRTTFQHSAEC